MVSVCLPVYICYATADMLAWILISGIDSSHLLQTCLMREPDIDMSHGPLRMLQITF